MTQKGNVQLIYQILFDFKCRFIIFGIQIYNSVRFGLAYSLNTHFKYIFLKYMYVLGLGCLIMRKDSSGLLEKTYFGGSTVEMYTGNHN